MNLQRLKKQAFDERPPSTPPPSRFLIHVWFLSSLSPVFLSSTSRHFPFICFVSKGLEINDSKSRQPRLLLQQPSKSKTLFLTITPRNNVRFQDKARKPSEPRKNPVHMTGINRSFGSQPVPLGVSSPPPGGQPIFLRLPASPPSPLGSICWAFQQPFSSSAWLTRAPPSLANLPRPSPRKLADTV